MEADRNGDGIVNFEEFQLAMGNILRKSLKKKRGGAASKLRRNVASNIKWIKKIKKISKKMSKKMNKKMVNEKKRTFGPHDQKKVVKKIKKQ